MSSRARFRRKFDRSYSHPKSAESLGSGVTLIDLSDVTVKCTTPYRLPRISPHCESPVTLTDTEAKTSDSDRVFGRFGYEDVIRMPALGPAISKALINPHDQLAHTYRQSGLMVPKFKQAAITPTYRHTPYISSDVTDLQADYNHPAYLKSHTEMSAVSSSSWSRSQSVSPVKSAKSIHWALGHERSPLFDASGRSRAQGPFSREFTVRCQPPPNWMRMKWGRSRTMGHAH